MTEDDKIYFVFAVCGLASAILIHRFRHYLQPRRPGESWGSFITRAMEEHRAYLNARATIHGSRGRTTLHSFITSAGLVGLMLLMSRSPNAGYAACGYLLVGFWWSPKLVKLPEQYHQVTTVDRWYWRLDQAWLWPLHLWRRAKF